MEFRPSDAVAAIRDRIDHPVVDADGHQIEPVPVVADFVRQVGGADAVQRFQPIADRFLTDGTPCTVPADMLRSSPAALRVPGGYSFPAENTLDLATAMLPELLYRRLDEFGIDFALVYPTVGLGVLAAIDDEFRPILARALNTYYLEAFAGLRDRLEPVAVIPMGTPDEAITELDFAVGERGLKAVVMGGAILRLATVGSSAIVDWIDTLGHGSQYDYDPVWARCAALGVTPTFHSIGQGWGTRASRTNFVYNHLGHFAAAQEGVCRSLVMGGVLKRFPSLTFAFLEGGVGWGAQLYSDLLGHFEKRNRVAIEHSNPARIDLDVFEQLLSAHGTRGPVASMSTDVMEAMGSLVRDAARHPEPADDFAESKIIAPDDIVDMFARQIFLGCEADDPINALAFDQRKLPYSARLNAMFASDIGHFDVTDMRMVLPEAWELVEHGVITTDDFRDFTFANAVRMLTAGRPDFFADTTIADAASKVTRGTYDGQPRDP